MSFTVGIIGGGIAGSTIAIKLSEEGIKCSLFEAGPELVNGPPVCHLHAGGALYRDIPIQQCVSLLKESIETLKCYKFSANVRPTLLTVPLRDPGEPEDIIHRLKLLAQQYQQLIEQDSTNAVLGDPADYFKVFTKQDVYRLREYDCPSQPQSFDDWLIPPIKYMDLQQFKFPFVMVQQYGLSSMRTSAYANIALEKSRNSEVFTNCQVINIEQYESKQWKITYRKGQEIQQRVVQFLINAGGYKSGYIDDMAGFKRERMLEFKAAYVTQWKQCKGHWPQIIIHGQRNTPFGMAQLTPYANNIFQIHGMTQAITLFQNGLVASTDSSSQPIFNEKINKILEEGWEEQEVVQRTKNAIAHVANFIQPFSSAQWTKRPLYGAQQIPGLNPHLRAAEISYQGQNYARSQIVKASTAIRVAQDLVKKLKQLYKKEVLITSPRDYYDNISEDEVLERSKRIAKSRNYPTGLAEYYR